jgi:AcrR family transcriptional regulator
MTPNNPDSPTLDEYRTNLRRTQILEAATRVFADKGYHHATTKDIARQAGMAEGTIYLYFKTKAELLFALIEHFDQATTQTEDLMANFDLSLRELLTGRLKTDMSALDPNFDLFIAIIPEILADPALRASYYERLVAPGIEGLISYVQIRQERGDIHVANIPMAIRVFYATLLGLEILHILGDDIVRAEWQNPEALAEDIAQVLFDGLQPGKETPHD